MLIDFCVVLLATSNQSQRVLVSVFVSNLVFPYLVAIMYLVC